jgi:DGQHR domain-containing protein
MRASVHEIGIALPPTVLYMHFLSDEPALIRCRLVWGGAELRMNDLHIECLRGVSASRPVLLGFAGASILHDLSFADVLDEDTGEGYQRRFNAEHSLDFRRYIQAPGSATIPLTFNLRPSEAAWSVVDQGDRAATLILRAGHGKCLAQVDCQHRLGHLSDLNVELPFMCFQGLSRREEMEVFSIINGKAKGLSRSLLDFHDAQLCGDLGAERPELFVALYLKNEMHSPWRHQLDLGGGSTSGMTRRASLRTIQKATKRFLTRTRILQSEGVEVAAKAVLDFWAAVALVLPDGWHKPRTHLLTKGIGVYALMDIAADLWGEKPKGAHADKRYFIAALGDFATEFDWSTDGPLRGLGGEGGVKTAVGLIREARRRSRLKVVGGG